MSKVNIVYFPATRHEMHTDPQSVQSDAYTPIVKWGVEVYRDEREVMYTVYQLRQFSEVNGIPYADFIESEKIRIPKGTLCCDLNVANHMTWNEHANLYNEILSIDIKNPESLKSAIEKGYLIPKRQAATHISIEIEKPYYYLKKVSDSNVCCPHASDDTYTIQADKCYLTYEEANTQAKAMIAEQMEKDRYNLEMDFRCDCDYQLNRLPEVDKSKVESLLRLLPHSYGFCLRYYNNQLLYRPNLYAPFQVIYTDSEYTD